MIVNLVMLIQVISALVIVGLVLMQHGKGADMGAAFGSGASGSLFGASGSSNFLSKSTGVAAAIFFASTLGLAYLGASQHVAVSGGALDALPVTAPASSSASASAPAPAAPVAATPVTPAATPSAAPVAAPATQPAAAAPASSQPAPAKK
jgi:preprotein translocase subunit SecG